MRGYVCFNNVWPQKFVDPKWGAAIHERGSAYNSADLFLTMGNYVNPGRLILFFLQQ